MRNLIEFIIRYRNFFSFFVLELVCFTIIVNYNREQRQILLNSTSTYAGTIFDIYSNALDYLDLREENKKLERENTQLRQYLQAVEGSDFELDSLILDSLNAQYEFIPAKIIKNSIVALDNMITLDVGKKQGVDKHMGVISMDGLIGITVGVSENYSVAMSLLHRQTRVSSRLRSTPYFGSLVWKNERDPTVLDLDDVPKHANIELGDTVETSGYSFMFPPGIPIGTIASDSLPEGNNFYTIKVKLMNDLSKMEHVYVVKNKDRQELLNIEGNNE